MIGINAFTMYEGKSDVVDTTMYNVVRFNEYACRVMSIYNGTK